MGHNSNVTHYRGFLNGCAEEDRRDALREVARRQLRFDASPTRRAQALRKLAVSEHAADRIGEGLRVLGRNEERRLLVGHVVVEDRAVGRDE